MRSGSGGERITDNIVDKRQKKNMKLNKIRPMICRRTDKLIQINIRININKGN